MKLQSLYLAVFLAIIPAGILGCAHPGRNISTLKMLSALGKDEKLKQRAAEQETENFRRLKYYIANDKIEKGISARDAIEKFGKPVTVLYESETQEWAYKPGDADWFGGEKIYLLFDKQGKLTGWECVDCI